MDILPIETPRLLLRQFAVEDAEDVFAIFSDEQTTLDCGGYHAFDAMDEEYGRLMQKFAGQTRRGTADTRAGQAWGWRDLGKRSERDDGLLQEPRATAEVLTADGWFRTGDLGCFDKRGRLYIKGRAKTTIVGASGENIYPEDIESVINNDRFVVESLVVEEDGGLVAKILLNIEELEKSIDHVKSVIEERKSRLQGFDERIEAWKQTYRKELNSRLNRNSQIKRIDVMDKPFEKTASQKDQTLPLYQAGRKEKRGKGENRTEKSKLSLSGHHSVWCLFFLTSSL